MHKIVILDKHRALVPHVDGFIETGDGFDVNAPVVTDGAKRLHPWPVPDYQRVIICECPHEQCDDPIFESHTGLTETTVCPNCGRQQAPHIVTDQAKIAAYYRAG